MLNILLLIVFLVVSTITRSQSVLLAGFCLYIGGVVFGGIMWRNWRGKDWGKKVLNRVRKLREEEKSCFINKIRRSKKEVTYATGVVSFNHATVDSDIIPICTKAPTQLSRIDDSVAILETTEKTLKRIIFSKKQLVTTIIYIIIGGVVFLKMSTYHSYMRGAYQYFGCLPESNIKTPLFGETESQNIDSITNTMTSTTQKNVDFSLTGVILSQKYGYRYVLQTEKGNIQFDYFSNEPLVQGTPIEIVGKGDCTLQSTQRKPPSPSTTNKLRSQFTDQALLANQSLTTTSQSNQLLTLHKYSRKQELSRMIELPFSKEQRFYSEKIALVSTNIASVKSLPQSQFQQLVDESYTQQISTTQSNTYIQPSILAQPSSQQHSTQPQTSRTFETHLNTIINTLFPISVSRIYASKYMGIPEGVLLGVTDSVPREVYQDFLDSGLVYLVAASGGNISLLTAILSICLIYISIRKRRILQLLSVTRYTYLLRGNIALARATVSYFFQTFAKILGRAVDSRRLLLIILCVMGIYDPFLLTSSWGLVLSISGLRGIFHIPPQRNSHRLLRNIAPSVRAFIGILGPLLVLTQKINILTIVASIPAQVLTILISYISLLLLLFGGDIFGLGNILFFLVKYLYLIAHTVAEKGLYVSSVSVYISYGIRVVSRCFLVVFYHQKRTKEYLKRGWC